MPPKEIIAAATRLKEAWDVSLRRRIEGQGLSDADIVEMHEAALGLMWATKAATLQEALDVLNAYEEG